MIYKCFNFLKEIGNSLPSSNVTVTGIPAVQSISQNSGSVYGGSVLTITGNGFGSISNTQIKIGTKYSTIQSVTASQIVFTVPSNSAGNYSMSIISNNITFPASSFIYSNLLTPSVTQITPTSGTSGQTVILTGSGFGNSTSKYNLICETI